MKLNLRKLIIWMLPFVFVVLAIYFVLLSYSAIDESSGLNSYKPIELKTFPGFCIYKTKRDYFDKVSCCYKEGKIMRSPVYTVGDQFYYGEKDTVYKCRVRLCEGYVLDQECSIHDIFLDITIKDYLRWEIQNGMNGMPKEHLSELVLDTDPFKEFWYVKDCNKGSFTIQEIEKLILDDNLNANFKRLK